MGQLLTWDDEMRLYVRTLRRPTIAFDLSARTTFHDLKLRILEKLRPRAPFSELQFFYGLNLADDQKSDITALWFSWLDSPCTVDEIRLVYSGRLLDDDTRTLVETNIGRESLVHCIGPFPRSLGGLRLASCSNLLTERFVEIVPCPWNLDVTPYDPICELWPCRRPIEVRVDRSRIAALNPGKSHDDFVESIRWLTHGRVIIEKRECGTVVLEEDFDDLESEEDLILRRRFLPLSGFEPEVEYLVTLVSRKTARYRSREVLKWYFRTEMSFERGRFLLEKDFFVGMSILRIGVGDHVNVLCCRCFL